MAFLTGRATFQRLKVPGDQPRMFGDEHLAKLAAHAAGTQKLAAADNTECGWAAGESVLDTDFTLAKNVFPDALAFDLRIDTDKHPPDLVKAYYQAELKALAANNPSGLPSARQKREARESARERLEHEAKDGRFRKRKCVPVLWHAPAREVWVGATGLTHVARFCALFRQTFGIDVEPLTAGRIAAALDGRSEESAPAAFVPGVTPADVAWIPDDQCRDFLGNEFLLWLWWRLEVEGDTIPLPDGSEAAVMLARTLVLDCPRGQTGTDGIRHEGPTRLPEAKRAAQGGKLPRRAGLTCVRHDRQYEFALHAEPLAVGSARLPDPPEDETDARSRLEGRVEGVRELVELIDGLYAAFLAVRLGGEWRDVLPRMQKWLARDERRAG